MRTTWVPLVGSERTITSKRYHRQRPDTALSAAIVTNAQSLQEVPEP